MLKCTIYIILKFCHTLRIGNNKGDTSMLRLMVRMGIKGRRHKIADERLCAYMHDNGIGV